MKVKFSTAIFLIFVVTSSFSQGRNTAKLDSLFNAIDANKKFMGSMAISENGKVVYSKAIGFADVETAAPANDKTKYRIGSISKMFTAALTFKAIGENKLSLSTTIDKYFPKLINAKKITVGNLLNHHSGIHNFTDDAEYVTYNTQKKSDAEMLTIIEKGKSDFEPNTKAAYSNSNYVLLTLILEKIYKMPLDKLLNERIIKPLQLNDTYVGGKINNSKNEASSYSLADTWIKVSETDMSVPKGAGSLISTPADLVKFIEGLFSGKIISIQSLEQMKTLQDDYGMGMFRVPYNEKRGYGHTGGIDGFQSVLYYFPEDKVAIAITSNGQGWSNNDLAIAGLSWYFKNSFVIPNFKNIITQTEMLDPYLGEYSAPDFPLKISVTKEDLTLTAQATGQSSFPLDAVSKDKFEFKPAGIRLEFIPAEKKMILKQGGAVYTLTKE